MIELGAAGFRYRERDELPVGDIPKWIKRVRSRPTPRKGWRVFDMPWGEVFGPVDLADLKQVAHWVDQFLGMMQRTFGVPLLMPLSVRVAPAAEYDRYCVECGAPGVQAFYNNEKAEIAVGLGKAKTEKGFQFELAHESTHAYMDLAIGFLGPPWFAEGIADYFANFYFRRGLPTAGAITTELLWEAYEAIDRVNLSKLLQYGWTEFYKDKDANYAVSLAFIHYLMSRVGLKKLFETVYAGRSSDLLRYEADFRRELEEFVNPPPPPGYQPGQIISH